MGSDDACWFNSYPMLTRDFCHSTGKSNRLHRKELLTSRYIPTREQTKEFLKCGTRKTGSHAAKGRNRKNEIFATCTTREKSFQKRPREPDVEGKNWRETKQSRGVFGASKAIGHWWIFNDFSVGVIFCCTWLKEKRNISPTSRKVSRVVFPCGTGWGLRPSIHNRNNWTLETRFEFLFSFS